MRKVNAATCELDEPLSQNGFRHLGASVAPRLGARRIGAGVYAMEAETRIWPYHFHTGGEEWLYVISGTPLLRDLGGERELGAGDFVAFPSGPAGVHTISGPGRAIIFSTAGESHFTVYPDSGKFGAPFGIFRVEDRVDYWTGEGSGQAAEPVVVKPLLPAHGPSRPVVNGLSVEVEALSVDEPAGFRLRRAQIGPLLGSQMLGATVYELDPGEGTGPYHYEYGCEEWVLVLAGAPELRRPGGQDQLDPGDLVCFAEGPDGAHRLLNRTADLVRVAILSTKDLPVSAIYPDSGKVLLYNASGEQLMLRISDAVDYWEGEV